MLGGSLIIGNSGAAAWSNSLIVNNGIMTNIGTTVIVGGGPGGGQFGSYSFLLLITNTAA